MRAQPVTIFLIEDNDVDAEAMRRAFLKEKVSNPIVRAGDGVEALERLRRGDIPKPYIILLDLNMPKMGGLELLKEIRADSRIRDSVVFVLTTSRTEQDKLAAYESFVAGYMVKSDVGRDFCNLINMFDAYWRVVELPVGANT